MPEVKSGNYRHVPLDAVKAHPKNPRRGDVEAIAGSIAVNGFYGAIVVQESTGYILAGNHRHQAAKATGLDRIPAIFVDVDDVEAERILLVDNRSNDRATYDDTALAAILEGLQEAVGLSGTGYTDEDLAEILERLPDDPVTAQGYGQGGGPSGNDEAPPAKTSEADRLREAWAVAQGQVWEIPSLTVPGGVHRIMCGDSTSMADVLHLFGEERAPLVFTDPPYNIAGKGKNYAATASEAHANLEATSWDQDFQIGGALQAIRAILAPDASVYICTSQHLAGEIWAWMAEWAAFHNFVAWCKPNPMPSLAKRHWTWGIELIAYATQGRHTFNFPEEGHALSWWNLTNASHTTEHPTEKPPKVPAHAIRHSSAPGDLVADLFGGSFSTLVACEQEGRLARAMELSPSFVAVGLQRAADMGMAPRLLSGPVPASTEADAPPPFEEAPF